MQNLIEIIQHPIGKKEVEQLASGASSNTFTAKDLIDLSLHQDQQIGFRAAWILERLYSNHQKQFLPFANYFLAKLPTQQNLSALRHYAKILAFITHKNASLEIKTFLLNYDAAEVVEVVFGWLIDEKIPVATKSHGLNILANLVPRYPWIRDELIETMEFLIHQESIAFFAKVKQIRKQLKVLAPNNHSKKF